MPLQFLFWGLYILAVIFSVVGAPAPFNWRVNAGNLLLFILVGRLGYRAFGAAIHG